MSARSSTDSPSRSTVRLTGPVLFILALLLFVLTLSQAPYPGQAANFTVRHTESVPFSSPLNGVWELVSSVVASLSVGTLAGRLAWFSALCGAACVWLLYELNSRVEHDKTLEEAVLDLNATRAKWLTGVIAALTLAASVPFWAVSSRAHVLSFGVLLLLLSAFLLQGFDRNRKSRWLWGSAFLYGLGLAEFPTLVWIAPLYTVYLWIAVLAGGPDVSSRSATMLTNLRGTFGGSQTPWRSQVIVAFLSSLLGFSIFFVLALRFAHSPAAEWAGVTSYGDALMHLVRQHWIMIVHVVPKTGWLLVALTAVVPWLLVMNFPKDGHSSREALYGSFAIHAGLGALAIALIANCQFSPWVMLRGRLWIVVPYVLIASWTGYVAGYGYIVLFHRRDSSSPIKPSFSISDAWLARLRVVYVACIFLGLGVAAAANVKRVDARQGDFLHAYAEITADHLGDRTWVVGSGPVLNNLRIELHERKMDVQIIDMGLLNAKPYKSYLAGVLPDDRLKALVDIGFVPLLSEWFRLDPDLDQKLAVIDAADLLTAVGKEAIPHGAFFVPGDAEDAIDAEGLMAMHRSVWTAAEAAFGEAGSDVHDQRLQFLEDNLSRTFSKLANNLGVLLEDHGEDALAVEAYNKARDIYPENLSSLMNLFAITRRLDSVQHDEVKEEFESYLREQETPARVWSLASYYGYVRNTFVFRDLGLMWAFSGKRDVAIRELERAAEMEEAGAGIQLALAGLYAQEGQNLESEAIYQKILDENPGAQNALLGMVKLSSRTGDLDGARTYLDRLAATGPSESLIQVERAGLAVLAGDKDEAKSILEALLGADDEETDEGRQQGYFSRSTKPSGEEVSRHGYLDRGPKEKKLDPDRVRAISLLALMASEEGDEAAALTWADALVEVQEESIPANLALAEIARQQRDSIAARRHLEQALRIQPTHQQALETLLNLDVAEGRIDLAEEHVIALLGLDPQHPQANLVLGTIQFERGELDLAENSFTISKEALATSESLNSLAWIRVTKGDYEEGLRLSTESLALNAEDGSAWDTRGVALMRSGRFGEAKDAFLKAVEYSRGRPRIVLHLAESHLESGEKEQAGQLLADLMIRAPELSETLLDEIAAMQSRLDTL